MFAGATAIGLAPIFVRLSELGPIATAFYRLLLALPVLWLWSVLDRRRGVASAAPVDRRWLVAAGLFFAADLAVWHWSIRITSVANATLLANLAPVFVTAAGIAFFGHRYGRRFFAGLVVALCGAVVLMSSSLQLSRARLAGDALGALTAVFYAGYILSVARLRATTSTATVMLMSGAVTAVALLLLAVASGERLLPTGSRGWFVLVALALVSHVGGQGLIAWALRHASAGFGSVSLLWQPMAAALFAWALLGEPLGLPQLFGGTLVLAGIVLARRAS